MTNLETNSESNSPEHNRQFFFDAPATATPASPAGKPAKQKRQKTGLTATSALIIGSLVGGGIGGAAGVASFLISSRPAPIVVNNQSDVSWVTSTAAVALPSVVTISVDGSTEAGTGSGVFLTDSGYILTNTHVVTLEGATSKAIVQVKTTDGHIYDATIIGTDPANDLAVIKISAPIKFTPIKFADSSKINVGDAVVALGAPLGLESSVTSGVVSALDRTIQVASSAPNQSGTLQWWNGNGAAPVSMKVIQTDASINPGNSGGALVNQRGELVGVNVAIATASSGSSTTGQSGSIGVGFAIPSNVAKRIGNELMTTGKASHGLFGAMVSDNGSAKSAAVGFSTGAKVQKLTSGGAAEKAGILVGDVVTKFDGHLIASSGDLTAAVRFLPAHTKVTVEINRAGKSLTFDVTLGDLATLK